METTPGCGHSTNEDYFSASVDTQTVRPYRYKQVQTRHRVGKKIIRLKSNAETGLVDRGEPFKCRSVEHPCFSQALGRHPAHILR